jgi:hypothetical protein
MASPGGSSNPVEYRSGLKQVLAPITARSVALTAAGGSLRVQVDRVDRVAAREPVGLQQAGAAAVAVVVADAEA